MLRKKKRARPATRSRRTKRKEKEKDCCQVEKSQARCPPDCSCTRSVRLLTVGKREEDKIVARRSGPTAQQSALISGATPSGCADAPPRGRRQSSCREIRADCSAVGPNLGGYTQRVRQRAPAKISDKRRVLSGCQQPAEEKKEEKGRCTMPRRLAGRA